MTVVSIVRCARALREALASFDAAVVSGEDCARLVKELAATEKACAAAKAVAAARAASCQAHRTAGFPSAADWLARESGTSVGEAKAALETAENLEAVPRTREALLNGEVSLDQASEITRTEKARPGTETELLDLAKKSGLAALRDRARKRRHEAIDPEELHRRQHASRKFRHWSTDLGMVGFAGELPPEIGVPIMNRLDAETDRIHREAKRVAAATGESLEARDASAADALVRMLSGQGKGRASTADVVIVADIHAWQRGHAHEGEVCHIIGGGPVPVHVARKLAVDAFLKAVIHDGVNIQTVAHFGRHIKAELRTALGLGAPPEFDGVACCEPGCDRRHGLEWDHVDPVANRGPTSYQNLKPRCWPHHQEKTERDRLAGLLGPPHTGPPHAGPP